MSIGIFGGTFNPPHLGHLIVAEHVRSELALDRIIFVPASTPPHKVNQNIVSADHRLAMLRLTIGSNPCFEVSDIEIRRGGISFTIDTVGQLVQTHPSDRLSILIGMDNLLEFHTWKSPELILKRATVIVMTRPGFDAGSIPDEMKNKVTICAVPEIGISSRGIREKVHEGKSIQYLVTDPVREYIYEHRLFSF